MKKTLSNGGQQEDVDGLLRSFFGREMPDPWPEARVPRPVLARPTPRSQFRFLPRLALAASVILILGSYLKLADMFPAEPGQGLALDRIRTIGSKLNLKQRVQTPGGGEALLWEETIPGDRPARPTIIINVQEIKSPQKR